MSEVELVPSSTAATATPEVEGDQTIVLPSTSEESFVDNTASSYKTAFSLPPVPENDAGDNFLSMSSDEEGEGGEQGQILEVHYASEDEYFSDIGSPSNSIDGEIVQDSRVLLRMSAKEKALWRKTMNAPISPWASTSDSAVFQAQRSLRRPPRFIESDSDGDGYNDGDDEEYGSEPPSRASDWEDAPATAAVEAS